jgi:hypothetical protein
MGNLKRANGMARCRASHPVAVQPVSGAEVPAERGQDIGVILRTVKAREGEQRPVRRASWGVDMDLGTVLIIVLILLLIGAIPRWGYSRGWGYGPSGLIGIILIIILVLALTGRV